MRYVAEIENLFTATQRIIEYTKLESEDELTKDNDQQLVRTTPHESTKWPFEGSIEFQDVTMRYREFLEPSVRGLTFKAQPRMKVGIVGRTGAGKSSILQTLFRLVDIDEGKIEIDGVDIREVGLHLLRNNIAFIPQTPFLLQGTIRQNLDPFIEKSDQDIWSILKEVNLFDHINNMTDKLDTIVSESNNLFSVG